MITIRQATNDDMEDMFRWKNDPITRQFAIKTHKKILWKNHVKWFEQNKFLVFIICQKNIKIGTVSIVPEIRIIIDPEYRGQGFAFKALQYLVQPGYIAKIVNGNIASMRLFLKLGFKPICYNEAGYYIFQK
jgi:RimJ/RimL family protein N-acetyltransferase